MFLVPRIGWARFRTRAAFILTLAATLGVAAAPASAAPLPIGWQASAGWYTEGEDFFIGAGARLGFAGVTVIPNAEWLFVDSGSAYTLNLDGTMNVLPLGAANGYVGAGIGLFTVDPEFGDSNTDTAFNVIAGAGLNAVPLKPFAQLKWIVVDGDDPLVFSVGARF
jgi:hypothetical protein